MTRLRRVLGPIAVAWLSCQVAAVTIVPAVFWAGSSEQLLECRCTHGDHAICPMHHKPAPGSKICLMRSAGDSDTGVLSSLFRGGIGLVPVKTAIIAATSPEAIFRAEIVTHSRRSEPPDPPPPRA